MESWRSDVALGIATVADLPRYQLETAGRTHGEALAHFSAQQDQEDARLQAAAIRYGQRVAALGPDGDARLAQLLGEDDDKRVPAGRRLAWERGA